jgi:signal transduction histidine kinase
VAVTDDGCGLAADARPGVGLVSMRRRAEELGGTLEVGDAVARAVDGSRPGTLVLARLPVEVA